MAVLADKVQLLSADSKRFYCGKILRYTPGEPAAMVISARMRPERGEECSLRCDQSALSDTLSFTNS